MKKYKGIIFDLDGTLLNSLEDLMDAVNHTMKAFHLKEKNLAEVRQYVGNGVKRLIELCVPEGEKNSQFDAILDEFKTFYNLNCDHKTKPYDGLIDLLQKLKAEGYQLGIVSNKIDPAVKALNAQYFSQWVEFALGERSGLNRKPSPDMVKACIKEMGLLEHEVVYIGDSEVDIETAKNSGIDCICVNWGFRDEALLIENGAGTIVSDAEMLYDEISKSNI